jgi:hypothetical protein
MFLLFFFLAPKSALAFMGKYSYDINSIKLGAYGVVIDGWAVLNQSSNNLMNNINPKYSLIIETKDKNGNVLSTYTYNNEKEDYLPWKQCYVGGGGRIICSWNAKPYDYTKAYYHVGDAGTPYPTDTYNQTRCSAMKLPGSVGSKFLINTSFQFTIPSGLLRAFSLSSSADKVYLTLRVKTGVIPEDGRYNSNSDIFTCSADSINRTEDIPLVIQQTSIKDPYVLDSFNLELENTAKQVTVIVGGGYVQGNPYAFLSGDSYRLVEINNKIVKQPSSTFKPNLHYVQGGEYSVAGVWTLSDLGAQQPKYNYYVVKVKLGGGGTVVDGGSTYAYIPAFWVLPTEVSGEPTVIKKKQLACEVRPECSVTSIKNEGTRATACEVGKPDCCSLCNSSAYKNTDFCTNPNKCGSDDDDDDSCPEYPSCTARNGLTTNTNCPVNTECCNSICAISANKSSAYCTNMCSTPPVTECTADPQKCYCQAHGSEDSTTCDIYKEKDKSTARKDKCSTTNTIDNFKYPTKGYGDNKFSNEACRISCEEIVKITFQPKQSVRAGMGYEYPIKINGTRYCTAQYKNRTWSQSIITAGSKANTEYQSMVDDLKIARDADNSCGVQKQVDAGTTCTAGESLTSDGQCKKSISFSSCPDSSSSSELSQVTTSCSVNGGNCDCTTVSKTRTITGYRIVRGRRVTIYSQWSTSTNNFSTSRCSGSYENGICYAYRGACPSKSSWNGSRCIKIMCSNNLSVYFDDAQVPILNSINAANAHRTAYTTAVNTFNSLMRDRTTCDNYASTNQYSGSKNVTTSYKENGVAIQVSTQKAYSIVSAIANGTTSIGTRITETKNIMKNKNKTLSITSNGYNKGTIGSYSGSYSDFYNATATYYDYWNEKSSAVDTLEFSKNYYVQRYTGELSTTYKPGYEHGGRLVYTDFYQQAKIQKFTLRFNKIGPNLPLSTDNTMKINSTNKFDCTYAVTNLIFPPEGDATHDRYGNVAFDFRQISLTNPFPGRGPRENWRGKQSLITSRGYEVYNTHTPMYEYYLDPTRMQKIRIYNNTNNYGSYDINNPYNSIFLDKYGISW